MPETECRDHEIDVTHVGHNPGYYQRSPPSALRDVVDGQYIQICI